nr:MAG TPA: hypothetical protein [Caudoviricetes sp.]DAL67486.1 MAG TPA: hypothetical protein [Caudoviricetes sp.]DAV82193.1 MAG TPA: hypothetical protein [Caudoviricetes sp.]
MISHIVNIFRTALSDIRYPSAHLEFLRASSSRLFPLSEQLF